MIPSTTQLDITDTTALTSPLLQLNAVSKYFPIHGGFLNRTTGAVQAVHNVDLSVFEGETLGIVGESGCGKSTLARCILQLIRPTHGQVLFEGQDLCKLSQSALRPLRKNFQMIFQNPYASLNPKMSIEQIITEPFEVHHLLSKFERKEEVKRLLDLVGLSTSSIEKYPHELSGGQCQRVGIARALALKPKLIIADEAVSALDVSVQAQIINLLQDLKQAFGLTYIFISHNMSVVEYLSDRVAVMYLGQIVELAKTQDLYANPRHPYTQALLSAVPIANPEQKHRARILLQGDLPSPANPPSGCRFHTRCQYKTDICVTEEPSKTRLNQEGSPEKEHDVYCHHAKIIPAFNP